MEFSLSRRKGRGRNCWDWRSLCQTLVPLMSETWRSAVLLPKSTKTGLRFLLLRIKFEGGGGIL